ncbi:hypothetical protein PP247_gp46 [Streptococcus phage P9854]|uniref:Uncharacterized protein n=1 Tax=Streptococcus phage P9854 TaxID=1971446 RepID=A0A286QS04_9CAUD|nr:hypothetical protein PP247_gp46 [Streptococcus phage P9854]ARU14691.1 hypothetical protein P9854_46 [Streptococcus phage P9854]
MSPFYGIIILSDFLNSSTAFAWNFFIYHHLYFKFQSCHQQRKTRLKSMYWLPRFYIFTGFVVKVCQLDVLSKKYLVMTD